MFKPTRKMPDAQQYIMALQNPQISFRSPELRQYRYLRGKAGQPIVYSGGFALTCPVQHVDHQHKIAVRFFYHLPDDMRERYEAISQFIAAASSQFFVGIEYQAEGVLIEGQYYPLCRMDWLEGLTLRDYVRQYGQDAASIQPLAKRFLDLSLELKRLRVAHGDLSHENIMVVNNGLVLVDYDGMYVPQLDGRKPCLTGQANFQHPQRVREDEFFGPYQDDFSALAIYISLLALQYNPTLFDRYNNELGSLLFRKSDFTNPERSRYLEELDQIPDLAELARRFRLVCQQDIYRVPTLTDFLRGTPFSITKSDVGLRTNTPSEIRPKDNIIELPEPRLVTLESSEPDAPLSAEIEIRVRAIDRFMRYSARQILDPQASEVKLRPTIREAIQRNTLLEEQAGSIYQLWKNQSPLHAEFGRELFRFINGKMSLREARKVAKSYIIQGVKPDNMEFPNSPVKSAPHTPQPSPINPQPIQAPVIDLVVFHAQLEAINAFMQAWANVIASDSKIREDELRRNIQHELDSREFFLEDQGNFPYQSWKRRSPYRAKFAEELCRFILGKAGLQSMRLVSHVYIENERRNR